MKEILGDVDSFVENINTGLNSVGISRDELSMMDHICYRVETLDRYAEMLVVFGGMSKLRGEASVNGRLIATFEFPEPLIAGGWRIPYLELPQPKGGSDYSDGLEHAELVVIGSLESFENRHADLPFDHKGATKKD